MFKKNGLNIYNLPDTTRRWHGHAAATHHCRRLVRIRIRGNVRVHPDERPEEYFGADRVQNYNNCALLPATGDRFFEGRDRILLSIRRERMA